MENIKKFKRDFLIKENEEAQQGAEAQAQDTEAKAEEKAPESDKVGIANPAKLKEEITKALNERIGDEYTAHFFYRNAANWCRNANYKKAAAFFEAEAAGELDHAKGIQDYLTQWNTIPAIPSVKSDQSFSGLVEIISKAYGIEMELLEKYSKNQQEFAGSHPATFNFVQKYVDLQNQAVGEYSDLLNALQLVNTENKLDLLVFEDRYFA